MSPLRRANVSDSCSRGRFQSGSSIPRRSPVRLLRRAATHRAHRINSQLCRGTKSLPTHLNKRTPHPNQRQAAAAPRVAARAQRQMPNQMPAPRHQQVHPIRLRRRRHRLLRHPHPSKRAAGRAAGFNPFDTSLVHPQPTTRTPRTHTTTARHTTGGTASDDTGECNPNAATA